MNDFTKNQNESTEIRINPKIKKLKKNARKRSLLENLESDTVFQDLDEIMGSVLSETTILTEDVSIRPFRGKYERYWFDRSRLVIHKDILTIQANGKVVIRSVKNIYHGEARYALNALLQLDITTQNEETAIPLTLLMYVGRHEYQNIKCLHVMSLTAGPDNNPQVNYEILIPSSTTDTLIIPQIIEVDSLEYLKLNHRYPELHANLQKKLTTVPAKTNW